MLYLYIIYLIKHRPIVLYAHVRSRVHARVRREKDIYIYELYWRSIRRKDGITNYKKRLSGLQCFRLQFSKKGDVVTCLETELGGVGKQENE